MDPANEDTLNQISVVRWGYKGSPNLQEPWECQLRNYAGVFSYYEFYKLNNMFQNIHHLTATWSKFSCFFIIIVINNQYLDIWGGEPIATPSPQKMPHGIDFVYKPEEVSRNMRMTPQTLISAYVK